jgi:hypothetical protein
MLGYGSHARTNKQYESCHSWLVEQSMTVKFHGILYGYHVIDFYGKLLLLLLLLYLI